MSFELTCSGWSLEKDLQIVHADVRLVVEGEALIEEPLCVDVGLPALLLSALEPVEPDRFADPREWRMMPFFCCGCGDPECRAFSFRVRHTSEGDVELTELEERQGREPRELAVYTIDGEEYRRRVLSIGQAFLQFIETLDYHPHHHETLAQVKRLVKQLSAGQSK
jgi:hypothetical protein